MQSFTFIHAADLHLGAPFRGLDTAASEAFDLSGAGFEALAGLEEACLAHNAAFLILSGDIYDDKDGVLRARFALRDMFLRLEKAGVRVFLAHGNHDPFREGPQPVSWPANVTVFGTEHSCECVSRNDAPLALVHGISHASERETANLSSRFVRYAPGVSGETFAALPHDTVSGIPADIFQIAVLHCAVGGAGEGHAPYAPCSLSDLTGAGFDYWALGHVHQKKILATDPYVVYPGSFQGLHINETGDHGCVAVRVENGAASVRGIPLAPVVWEKIPFSLEGETAPETLDALEESLLAVLEDNRPGSHARALFCRIVLEGRTGLDAILRRPGSAVTLLERLRNELAGTRREDGVRVWVRDIVVATSPDRDMSALAERGDLVGEVARLEDAVPGDADLAASLAAGLAPLFGHRSAKKILAASDTASPDSVAELAAEAKSLLASLLESE